MMEKMKVRFINFERTRLPEAILKHNVEEKRKFFADISLEDEKSEAEIQVCAGCYNFFPTSCFTMLIALSLSLSLSGMA